MALSAGYLRKPQDVMALTKDGAVGRIPEKATGRHGSDKRWRCRRDYEYVRWGDEVRITGE
jgi:hypothetical protein